jgi:hypothetical protein
MISAAGAAANAAYKLAGATKWANSTRVARFAVELPTNSELIDLGVTR